VTENKKPSPPEFKTNGTITPNGVQIAEQSSIDALSQRGYGTPQDKTLTLTFFEALYLQDKGMLEAKTPEGATADFAALLQLYEAQNKNAWVNYLVYRDLRGRGYVVREGFGVGADFRIYDRGTYGKDTAPYLVLVTQEGQPLPTRELADAVGKCQSQQKELIVAVMNRRGEVVYYSVGELHFPPQT
jgi:tRNA-intron endonuclease